MESMPEHDAAYPARFFERDDPSDDAQFYDWPRKVVHIDEGAIAALRMIYAEVLPRSGRLLDLMSAWRSHLPGDLAREAREIVGLGMNAEEMADNPQLHRYVVQDINRTPVLPFADASFDAAMCAVSVQYLTRPIEVFGEVARVLMPGAPFVVSFSNRCFPTKAVSVWHAGTDQQHVALVRDYFERSARWSPAQTRANVPHGSDPLFAVWATRSCTPPV